MEMKLVTTCFLIVTQLLVRFEYGACTAAMTNCRCSGENWFPFESKCFKLIKRRATREEAEILCNGEYLHTYDDSQVPTLASIKSAAEQTFLTKLIFQTSAVESNVWIGAKRMENANHVVWNDGSLIEFTNWAEGSPSEQTGNDCVEMQSHRSETELLSGLWRHVACGSGNYAVCEKLQCLRREIRDIRKELSVSRKDSELSFNGLQNLLEGQQQKLESQQNKLEYQKNKLEGQQNTLESLQNHLEGQKHKMESQQNKLEGQQNQLKGLQNQLEGIKKLLEVQQTSSVPIGFVYVQLSNQPEPQRLWPQTQWENISSKYAGLFFRVLGGDSAAFGQTQSENSPRISEIKNIVRGGANHHIDILANGDWTEPLWTGSDLYCVRPENPCYWSMLLKQSAGEVRPRNQAVQIWKRIN